MATLIVGVLNVTPDSFSDGGRFATVQAAVVAGLEMAARGAGWIDVGGESTRPGATRVSEEEETARVVPVVKALAARLAGRAQVCVDTTKSGVARAALAAGATVINDVSGGLADPRILETAAAAGAAVVLGHLRGTPATMMDEVAFDDVVTEVVGELKERIVRASLLGCREIWADPGIGFGKRLSQNLELLDGLPRLCADLAVPIMVGVSRKRFIGELTGQPTEAREFGTAAAVTAAILGGASAVRVHDVAAMADVVAVADAIREIRPRGGFVVK